jgi:hypothetical protein
MHTHHDDMPRRVRLPSGRPRAADPRRHRLRVAVSEAELAAIKQRAGGRRMSRFIRACALVGSPEAAALIDALTRALALGRGACGNLNQYSHRANSILAAAKGGTSGLDLAALVAEQRAMAALETDLRGWMDEMRSTVIALRGVQS